MVSGIKATGMDFTAKLLAQAKENAILAEVDNNQWREFIDPS